MKDQSKPFMLLTFSGKFIRWCSESEIETLRATGLVFRGKKKRVFQLQDRVEHSAENWFRGDCAKVTTVDWRAFSAKAHDRPMQGGLCASKHEFSRP